MGSGWKESDPSSFGGAGNAQSFEGVDPVSGMLTKCVGVPVMLPTRMMTRNWTESTARPNSKEEMKSPISARS